MTVNFKKNNIMEKIPSPIETIFLLLDEHKILYWLDACSLLKGVREQDILSSSDIDIATTSKSTHNLLEVVRALESLGYYINFQGGFPMFEDLIQITLPKKFNRIDLFEIYVYHEHDGNYIRRSPHKPIQDTLSKYLFSLSKKILIKEKNRQLGQPISHLSEIARKTASKLIFLSYEIFGTTMWSIVPSKFFDNFTSININGRIFKIPALYKEYLKFRYGNNWEIPLDRKEWYKSWSKGETDFLKRRRLIKYLKISKFWL